MFVHAAIQAAAIVRSPPTDGRHHSSARAGGVSCGIRVNGASKRKSRGGAGGGDGGSSIGEAARSSDYGGGTSSGSLSGSGADNSNNRDGEDEGHETIDGCRTSRKRARVVSAPVVTPCRDEQHQRRTGVEKGAGGGGAGGGQASVGGATPRALPPTARRLALSAKKTILFRHGVDSSKAGAVNGRV